MKLKKLLTIIMILTMTFTAAACGGASESSSTEKGETSNTRTFVDSVGREVEIPAEVNSIAPSGPLAQMVLLTACP